MSCKRGTSTLRFVLACAVVLATASVARAVVQFTATPFGPGPSVSSPSAVAAGNLGGSADADIATANSKGKSVDIFFGDGAGGFVFQQRVANVGGNPNSIATGDCDGDGDDDVFVANKGSNDVAILVNAGGSFSVSQTIAIGGGVFFVLARDDQGGELDLNGDGELDLVVARRGADKLTTLTSGPGNCTFAALQTEVFAGNAPEAVAAGDFDNVTGPDLAVASFLDDQVTILLNNPTDPNNPGLFATTCAGADCTQIPAEDGPSALITTDVNDDGQVDLVVTTANNGSDNTMFGMCYFRGQGDGSFDAALKFGTRGNAPQSVVAADFSVGDPNDPQVDVAVVNKSARSLASFQNAGAFGFSFVSDPNNPYPLGSSPESAAAGQFNASVDANPDVIVVNKGSNNFTTCLGNGDGTFACTTAAPGGGTEFGTGPRGVAISDLGNGGPAPNGDPDLVVVHEGSDDVQIFFGDSSGTDFPTHLFNPPKSLLDAPFDAKNPHAVVAFDADGDSTVDLAIAACGGTGLGTDKLEIIFDRNFALPQELSAGNCPTAVRNADFDGDGDQDLVVTNSKSDDISIFRNNGGTFSNIGQIPIGNEPRGCASADFGGDPNDPALPDGVPDLVCVNRLDNTVKLLLGSGDLSTTAAAAFSVAATIGGITNGKPVGIAAADFNQDGNPDVAVVNENTSQVGSGNGVLVYLGNGGPSFDTPLGFAAGDSPSAILAGTISEDTFGYVDLVVTNEGTSDVSILEGRGDDTPLFELAVAVAADTRPLGIAAGDLDGDADADLVSANFDADNFTILTNNSPLCGDSLVTGAENCDPPGTVLGGCPPLVCGPTCRAEPQ